MSNNSTTDQNGTNQNLIQKAVEDLMAKGLDRDTAETIVKGLVANVQATVPGKSKKDRSFIADCTDIQLIRKEMKSAYGGKSKAKGKQPITSEYEAQIKNCQARISELYVRARASEDPIQTLKDFNEFETSILQELVDMTETEYKSVLEPKYSKAGLKRECHKHKSSTPPSLKMTIIRYLGASGYQAYEQRRDNGDQRIITLNKMIHLVEIGEIKQA